MWTWITELVGKFFDKAREAGPGIVGRVMSILGVGWTTTNYGVPSMIAFLQSHAAAAISDVVTVLAYVRIPEAMSMIVSAYVMRMSMKVMLAPLRAITGSAPGAQS